MAISLEEAQTIRPGEIIRVISAEEAESLASSDWGIGMWSYCNQCVEVDRVMTGPGYQHRVYMKPIPPEYYSYYFLPEFIAEIVRGKLEPAEDEQLYTLLFGGAQSGIK